MAKKKVRKAGMVKRQQAKKHTKAQERRKFASRRMISNPQAATQKRLEELLSTLPFLAFSERFEDLKFDIQAVKEELEAKTPEPLLLMRLLTEEFLEGFRARFEEFEKETTPQSPDNLLAKATIHQLDHSNEIPHLSNPMIVAVYLKTRAEALGEVALTRETIHDALNDYEEGTWTPVFADATSGGNTGTSSSGIRGVYTKIGNMVTVNCSSANLNTSGMTTGNDLRIQGLPFTPTSVTSPNQIYAGATQIGSVAFSTSGFVQAYALDNATYVRLGESTNGGTLDIITVGQLTSGSADIQFTITYFTSA